MTFPTDISREELALLPIRRYEGDIHLVTTPQQLERAMADIESERVLGFDTETRPAFTKGESHLPCLVQIATARAVYLFQLRAVDCSAPLAALLGDPAVVKAGVSIAFDLKKLQQVFAFEEAGVVDLGVVAKKYGVKQTGVRSLSAMFLGYRIPKGASTTNWAARRLTPTQILYAATDAWASRELYRWFECLGWVGA